MGGLRQKEHYYNYSRYTAVAYNFLLNQLYYHYLTMQIPLREARDSLFFKMNAINY